MFVYQKSFASPCVEVTEKIWNELLNSSNVNRAILDARYYQQEIDKLPKEPTKEQAEEKKKYETQKQQAKKRLPGIIFQASFAQTQSKKGFVGTWRKNSASILNGLYILDIDHKSCDEINEITGKAKEYLSNTILLIFLTASGHGIKIVAKADPKIGNIEANQRHLAGLLGTEFDSACKDPARLSFCPCADDIIFIDHEIFTYNNEEFERIYGAGYRDGTLSTSGIFGSDAGLSQQFSTQPSEHSNSQTQPSDSKDINKSGNQVDGTSLQLVRPTGEEKDGTVSGVLRGDGRSHFGGVEYGIILDKYVEVKGKPEVGARHQWLLRTAKDLRYICDFDKKKVVEVLMLNETAQEVAKERGVSEIEKICEAACGYGFYSGYPKDLREACRRCGIELGAKTAGSQVEEIAIDYDYWWNRLKPLLEENDAYSDAVAKIADKNKLGGILSAGAMYGTYLTRCKFPFYDGKNYKFSYIVYIIGHAASGKSYIIDQDKEIMGAIKRQDETYRQMEREYREQKERMSTSSKDAKDKAPQRPHYPIRYVPSTISNAKLYARLQDAVDIEDDTLNLHLFTLESELATALRVQVGSWAGKLDLELKSFQNEYAGVDYANELSANGLIQVNWNQVISGTMDALKRKMRGGSITDGYITRMALWIMPNTDYSMIECKYDSIECDSEADSERRARIKARVTALDKMRCVFRDARRLADHCWQWCYDQCKIAQLEDDKCVEYFRKRIPIYMMRYTLPRIICRQIDKFEDGYLREGETLEILPSDLEFATLIGDYLMFISIYQWGQQYLESVSEEESSKHPRLRQSKFADRYFNLPKVFSVENLEQFYSSKNSARGIISILVKKGIIKKVGDNKWEKIKENFDNETLS